MMFFNKRYFKVKKAINLIRRFIMLKPQVIFKVKKLEKMLDVLTSFFKDDYLLDGRMQKFISRYFNFDAMQLKGKNWNERHKFLAQILTPIYNSSLEGMEKSVKEFQDYWDKNSTLICSELERIFNIKFQGVQQYYAEININPVSPRFLAEKSFDVNNKSTKQNALQICIHELIHFCWFDLWQQLWPETDTKNFESPHIEWLLSEIAIDPIVYFSKFKNLCNNTPAYKHFYESKIENENLIDIFRNLYKSKSISEFMKAGLELLENNLELVKELV